MGLFDNDRDSESASRDERPERQHDQEPEAGDSRGVRGGSNSREQSVTQLVEQIRHDPAGQRSVAIDHLTGPPEDRLVGARALARVAVTDPDVLDPETDRIVDHLADRRLARPIAEALLRSAHTLGRDGVGYETLTDGLLTVLQELDTQVDRLPQTGNGVPGGGASESALATELRLFADQVGGRKQLVVEATADAISEVVTTFAHQAGLDPVDANVELRSEYHRDSFVGVDRERGTLTDATAPEMRVPPADVRGRVTDGIALGVVVYCTRGTVSQLETMTGYAPY